MRFLKTIAIGALVGILVGFIPVILGVIPIIGAMILACNCFLAPLIIMIGGYLVGRVGDIRKDDWVTLAIQNGLYAFMVGVGGTAAILLLTILNIGTSLAAQQGFVGVGAVATGGIIGVIIMFFLLFIVSLFLGFVGGAIYLITAKK